MAAWAAAMTLRCCGIRRLESKVGDGDEQQPVGAFERPAQTVGIVVVGLANLDATGGEVVQPWRDRGRPPQGRLRARRSSRRSTTRRPYSPVAAETMIMIFS